jgi:hypothetical protein
MISAVISSGVTGIDTATDAAVELISAANAKGARFAKVVNTSAVAGFVSFDGGHHWNYLPAGTATVPMVLDFLHIPVAGAVQLKRIAGGSNVTGVFASVWQ